jgi:ribA/ribD-fused uncharacterized protein
MGIETIRSIETLLVHRRDGGNAEYLCFWGHRRAADGSIGKSCFSQWFEAAFVIDDIRYPTAEHFMMAAKARLFGDNEILSRVIAAPTARDAKALGRKVKGFDDALWTERRFELVVEGNLEKFGQNPKLRSFLLSTGDRVLVEASPEDRIWGIGMAEADERARNPEQWDGLNLLGFALMAVRARLKEQP